MKTSKEIKADADLQRKQAKDFAFELFNFPNVADLQQRVDIMVDSIVSAAILEISAAHMAANEHHNMHKRYRGTTRKIPENIRRMANQTR